MSRQELTQPAKTAPAPGPNSVGWRFGLPRNVHREKLVPPKWGWLTLSLSPTAQCAEPGFSLSGDSGRQPEQGERVVGSAGSGAKRALPPVSEPCRPSGTRGGRLTGRTWDHLVSRFHRATGNKL